jgi:uncharacterized DUF497 family protein
VVITFDPAKETKNLAKHRISLTRFADIDLESAVSVATVRNNEAREIVMGLIDHRLHVAIIVRRDQSIRVISLRKANKREGRDYAEAHA